MSGSLPPGFVLEPQAPPPAAAGAYHLPEMVVSPEGAPAPAPATLPPGFVLEGAEPTPQVQPPGRDWGWAPTAVARGVGGLLGLPRDIRDMTRGAVRYISPDAAAALEAQGPTLTDMLPGGRQIATSALDAAGIQEKDAETPLGRIGQTALEFGAGSLLGGSVPSIARNAAMGAVSGLASGGAGELARGTSLEAPARILGALAPPTAGAGLGVLRNRAVRQSVVPALRSTTPAQADAASRLMRQAEEIGSPITLPEAVQAASGQANRGLTAAQDVASNSVGGSRVMAPFMDRREAGARTAATNFVERQTPISPEAIQAPARLQDAAKAEIRAAEGERSNLTRPLYAAATQRVAADPALAQRVERHLGTALTDMDRLAAGNPALATTVERARERLAQGAGNWEALQDLRRELRDLSQARTLEGLQVLDRKTGVQLGQIERRLTRSLHMTVPELRAADAEFINLSRTLVEPIERGIIGGVAATANATTQRGLLFPQSPMAGGLPTRPQDAAEALGRLSGSATARNRVGLNDMQASRDLLGAELRTRLDEALRVTAAGQPDRVGARIASRMQPTASRTDALDASMRALPGGDQAADGFKRIMEVLGAQTFAPAANSATARRTEALRGMGGVSFRPREWVKDWVLNANTESLAHALTTPEGFHRLRAIAGIDNRARREAAIRALLSAHRAEQASE